MSSTDSVYTAGAEEQVCFGVEVRVPFSLAEEFADMLTGEDGDVLLAPDVGEDEHDHRLKDSCYYAGCPACEKRREAEARD